MLYAIGIFIGLSVGSLSDQGFMIGGAVGFLLVYVIKLKNSIEKLSAKLKLLEHSHTAFNKKNSEHVNAQETQPSNFDYEFETEHQDDYFDSNKDESQSNHQLSDTVALEQTTAVQLTENVDQFTDHENDHINGQIIQTEQPLHNQQGPDVVDFEGIIEKPTADNHRTSKQQSSFFEKAIKKAQSVLVAYFTGGNTLVRTGLLVLFVGVAFLLKYVAERTTVPIEFRYIGVCLGALGMLLLGWKLRKKRKGYALSLIGGGIGVLYLTLFAAMRLHGLLPAPLVLLLLVVIVVFSALIAIMTNSMALAIIGMIGGYAAPILTSTGSGSHVQLFSYYLLLNIGVFVTAWFKSWRILNVVGFIATFGIGTLWGYQYYKPEFLWSVEPFLIANFLMYTAIAVLFAFKQAPKLKGINDGTLIFGTPLVGFTLQAGLMQEVAYGLAYSALVLGVFYVLLSYLLHKTNKDYLKNLIESFVALGIGFTTISIPLAFDGRVTSAMWVAEGCALFWVGIRQARILPRFTGYALSILGSIAFFAEKNTNVDLIPWLNADYIGILILCIATAFIGLYARMNMSKLLPYEVRIVPRFMVVLSLIWWVFGNVQEIDTFFASVRFSLIEMFLIATVFILLAATKKVTFAFLNTLAIIVVLGQLLIIAIMPRLELDQMMFMNDRFIGLMIVSLSHFFMSWYWRGEIKQPLLKVFSKEMGVFLFSAITLWFYAFISEIGFYVGPQYSVNAILLMMISSILIFIGIAHKLSWQSLHHVKYLYLPMLLVMGFYTFISHSSYHIGYGLPVWLLAMGIHLLILRIYEQSEFNYLKEYHLLGSFLACFIIVFEAGEFMKYLAGHDSIWHNASYLFMLLMTNAGLYFSKNSNIWPISHHKDIYVKRSLSIFMFIAWFMVFWLNTQTPGQLRALPYFPVLNIIDLTGIFTLALSAVMLRHDSQSLFMEKNKALIILTLIGFLLLNGSMLRCFHYWYDMAYNESTMFASFMVQTGFSILWALTAVVLMVMSARKKWRKVWLVGLGLMMLVVAKLFLIDMSASGTIERIVAFLTVGILLSVVGYFSPLPPDVQTIDDAQLADEKAN